MERFNSIIHTWRTDFDFKTFISAGFSLVATLAFALYNGYLGILHGTAWNVSICIYYLVLSAIRLAIIFVQDRVHKTGTSHAEAFTRIAFRITSLVLIAMNVTLVEPISLMVQMEKPVHMGLVPAIAMAAYTFYRITMAGINYVRRTRSPNLLTRELRSINLMDALLAVASMQNALISATGTSPNGSILSLTAVSSAFLLIGIIVVSVRNYRLGMRILREKSGTALPGSDVPL